MMGMKGTAGAVAMAVFATAGGLSALLIARVLQGLATGAGIAAVGAVSSRSMRRKERC
jgi:MFS family permease